MLIYSGAKKKAILVGVRGQKVVIFVTRARAARARGQNGNFSRCQEDFPGIGRVCARARRARAAPLKGTAESGQKVAKANVAN